MGKLQHGCKILNRGYFLWSKNSKKGTEYVSYIMYHEIQAEDKRESKKLVSITIKVD